MENWDIVYVIQMVYCIWGIQIWCRKARFDIGNSDFEKEIQILV